MRSIENFRENRDRAKPIPFFEKFRDFLRNPIENPGLMILGSVRTVGVRVLEVLMSNKSFRAICVKCHIYLCIYKNYRGSSLINHEVGHNHHKFSACAAAHQISSTPVASKTHSLPGSKAGLPRNRQLAHRKASSL